MNLLKGWNSSRAIRVMVFGGVCADSGSVRSEGGFGQIVADS
jgi:hypothetical protein